MSERVTFASATGPILAGIVDLPPGDVRGWGVFSHGFTLGKDCPAASRICKQLASDGIGMLRFDNLGLGDSEGDWGDGSFSHKVADTVRAVEFMNTSGREVRLLVGIDVVDGATQRDAAKALHDLGPQWALVKGGHLRSAPNSPDLLYDGVEFREFDAPRVDTGHDHGAGDTLAAAIACALAQGYSTPDAVAFGKAWVTECLRAAYPLGAGHGPVSALFRLQS